VGKDEGTSLDEHMRALGALAAELEDPSFVFGSWEGGDEQPDGVITLPFYSPSERGLRLIEALSEQRHA
jgi:hypothetical protein